MRTCRRAALSESRRSARGGHVTACCHATRGETPFPLGRWDWEGSFDLLCACRIVLARSATVALGFAHREDRSLEFRFRPHRPRPGALGAFPRLVACSSDEILPAAAAASGSDARDSDPERIGGPSSIGNVPFYPKEEGRLVDSFSRHLACEEKHVFQGIPRPPSFCRHGCFLG
jgi:hypothetical protein